jgi:hypothetical protein
MKGNACETRRSPEPFRIGSGDLKDPSLPPGRQGSSKSGFSWTNPVAVLRDLISTHFSSAASVPFVSEKNQGFLKLQLSEQRNLVYPRTENLL